MEFQVDPTDMGTRAASRYGFVAIGIFSKKGVCTPIESKSPNDMAAALQKTLSELGYRVSIMLDEGGAIEGKFVELAMENDVEIVKSRAGG